LRRHGANLAATMKTYGYMFCWDQTRSGLRTGYPAEFFSPTIENMTAFLTDTLYLRDELTKMYQLPAVLQARIQPIFTPAQGPLHTPSIARQKASRAAPGGRGLVLWGGRLDRQKRFDLVQDIARRMPDVDFRCWGTALLDEPPDLGKLPVNVTMHGSFESFDDLPLKDADAWLFTASWEGMPTTIIELATRGMVVVASAVGGVPELIRPDTGWPVSHDADADDYVAVLRSALSEPDEAVRRAEMLQHRVASIYSEAVYDSVLDRLLKAEEVP
jgi:glycosyltransferase involved in cell wall biosynthesis